MAKVKLDLITQRADSTFVMHLVEQGPWTSDPIAHLRGIQERPYDYFDVAVDGQLANLYPESAGRCVVVRVDAYDTPPAQVSTFVQHFSEVIASSREHDDAIRRSPYVASLAFECEEKSAER